MNRKYFLFKTVAQKLGTTAVIAMMAMFIANTASAQDKVKIAVMDFKGGVEQVDTLNSHSKRHAAARPDLSPLPLKESFERHKGLNRLDKEAESLHTRASQRTSIQPSNLLRAASDEIASGTCGANGDNLTWTFDSATGTLTISGTGAMENYDDDDSYYCKAYGSQITHVKIEAGVTSIGNYAFYNCSNLVSVSISNSVTNIGEGAFHRCSSLASFAIPESVKIIGGAAFYNTQWYSNQPNGCIYIGKILWAYKGSMPANIEVAEGTISISDYAFFFYSSNKENLISVTIPASVTHIGEESVFGGCAGLTSIEVASANPSYQSENGVLFNKGKTVLIYFPAGKIGSYTIPAGVKTIAKSAFFQCYGLTAIIIPNSVETIKDEAFWQCTNLTAIIIPNSVEAINDFAFRQCANLTTVTINGNSLKTIGYSAFCDCTGLTSISLPQGLTSIDNWAFGNCTNLTSVNVPKSVTNIGESAFGNTQWFDNQPNGTIYINDVLYRHKGSAYGNIAVREGTVSLSGEAFYQCGGSYSITLPNTVKTIGRLTFGSSSLTAITIPNSVTNIGPGAFQHCNSLKSITIPNGITSIESHTFYGCQTLASITIGSSVESIGYAAFHLCYDLRSVTLPESLTSIDEWAFNYCGIKSIALPRNVKRIGKYAFSNNTTFTSVSCNATTPPVLGDWVFDFETIVACTPVVPAASLALYQQAPGWREFYSGEAGGTCGKNLTWKLNYADGTLTISGTGNMDNWPGSVYAPWYNYGSIITQVLIEDGVTSIGDLAFYYCKSLTSITIPNGITSIGVGAFYECNRLTSITIPNGVTSIGEWAFCNCNSLTSITIPNSVTSIEKAAFMYCGITSITLPENLTSIEKQTFYGSLLTSIIIPESVTSIGYEAFWSCKNLTSVTIGSNVESIGNDAFRLCENLASVVCYASNPPLLQNNLSPFWYVNTNACNLYVPDESIALYQAANVWKDFNIKAISEYSNVNVPSADKPVVIGYYSVTGMKLSQEPENGVYIVVYSNGKTEKMLKK